MRKEVKLLYHFCLRGYHLVHSNKGHIDVYNRENGSVIYTSYLYNAPNDASIGF